MEEDACGTARIERAEPKLLVPGRNLFLNMSLQWPVTQGGFEGAQPLGPSKMSAMASDLRGQDHMHRILGCSALVTT